MSTLPRPSRSVKPARRRGVVSVLAMMFLVLFGSLALAMAIVSKGNLRTASTQLHVTRALGAAETGLAVAKARLDEAAARFVIEKGVIDTDYARRFWRGDLSVENWENRGNNPSNPGAAASDGRVFVKPNASGFSESGRPVGLAQALMRAHASESNVVRLSGASTQARMISPPSDVPSGVYSGDSWLVTAPIGIDGSASDASPAAYQITYAPLANGTDIRVFVTGFSAVATSGSSYLYSTGSNGSSRPLSRTIQQDYRIAKRHEHAILSPSRVLIGQNVLINGPVGSRYNDVAFVNGDPVVCDSDFKGLNATLDGLLNQLYAGIAQYDTDGDNRLRTNDPGGESRGIPSGVSISGQDGRDYNPFSDVTGDGYVDDFDVFLNFYDAADNRRDGRIEIARMTNFPNPDLLQAIDMALPDRNANGRWGFVNPSDNYRRTTTSDLVDPDDRTLGWRDGYVDYRDQYAKIRGKLSLRATRSAWETARNGSYTNYVQGPINAGPGGTPITFGAGDDDLPDVASSTFNATRNSLAAIATGSFATQVAAQLVGPPPTRWEKMPLAGVAYYDYYQRPVYADMTFSNVTIPQGNNGLFVRCKFIGVTRIQTYTDNTNANWSLYGRLQKQNGAYVAQSQFIDKSDFPCYADPNVPPPSNYSSFLDPPIINGQIRTGAARDTKQYSNNIRFHDCTFVGSLVSDAPAVFTHVRNKAQFTGSTRFVDTNPDAPTAGFPLNPREQDKPQIAKSSMMLPNFSVDIGGFNAPTDTYTGTNPPTPQNVNLKGTVIAGMLDARGNTSIDGSLVLTFAPTYGQLPLFQNGAPVGNPANFNASLGYFADSDGDGESVDPATLQVINGVRIAGWDTDADGLVDVAATPGTLPPAGGVAIPWYGLGRVIVNFNPDLPQPDGLRLPVRVVPLAGTYREGQR
jgi:hypothetical protein